MHVYADLRKPHHVERVFRDMLARRILPDETAYLVLIDSYRAAGLGKNCERLMEEMKVGASGGSFFKRLESLRVTIAIPDMYVKQETGRKPVPKFRGCLLWSWFWAVCRRTGCRSIRAQALLRPFRDLILLPKAFCTRNPS